MSVDEPDGLCDALRPLLHYWIVARGEKLMPSRADIDPVAMPRRLLSKIVLLDVVETPVRFRYRLMGTAVTRLLGADWTRRFVDEIPGSGSDIHSHCLEVLEIGKPALRFNEHDRFDPALMQYKVLQYEQLLLPLSVSGYSVSMVLGGMMERG